MGFLDRFRRKKDDEASRVARLLLTGRIAEGRVVDVVDDADGNFTQVFYNYSVAGVDYESSQSLSPQQQNLKSQYIPGARVTVRYDPRQPPNATVV
jgi:lipase chaperone LimK